MTKTSNLTLVKLAQEYTKGVLPDSKIAALSRKINIFKVVGDNPETATYTVHDGNAWEDVRVDLVDKGKMPLMKYAAFIRLVEKARKVLDY